MLKINMPSFNDKEGSEVPAGLPPVIDAHVHVFPSNIFSAIRKWFDENAWHIGADNPRATTAKDLRIKPMNLPRGCSSG